MNSSCKREKATQCLQADCVLRGAAGSGGLIRQAGLICAGSTGIPARAVLTAITGRGPDEMTDRGPARTRQYSTTSGSYNMIMV